MIRNLEKQTKGYTSTKRHAPPQDLEFPGSACQGQGTPGSLGQSKDPSHRAGKEIKKKLLKQHTSPQKRQRTKEKDSCASPVQPRNSSSVRLGGLLTQANQRAPFPSMPRCDPAQGI
ncbi:hypothetical protein E2C01_034393 [Portunus trituberculatus]|uniref:Uncharacterized protein n=1 Tax=Portunus trituberculatus TaxID=210409 RepID=A0A5B7F8E7_PORTR|nr:hypothetical protein [Portunus trituberculatus]